MQGLVKDGNLIWINGAGYGYLSPGDREVIHIADQDVSRLFRWIQIGDEPDDGRWDFVGTLSDVEIIDPPPTLEERVSGLEGRVKDLETASLTPS